MVPMRKKAPRQASLDEVRITREGGIAVIEHADPNVSVSRVSIGPLLKTMSDAAVLDLFNRMIEAQEKIAAGYDRVAVEIPPGRPQIRLSESNGQWVPRGRMPTVRRLSGSATAWVPIARSFLVHGGRSVVLSNTWPVSRVRRRCRCVAPGLAVPGPGSHPAYSFGLRVMLLPGQWRFRAVPGRARLVSVASSRPSPRDLMKTPDFGPPNR